MRIGIDLGGTKIEAVVLASDSSVVFRQRKATPSKDYIATLDTIAALVHEADAFIGKPGTALGIGIPGIVSADTGLVKNANSTCLIGKPLDRDLEAKLNRSVRIANDANCFALSEASDGAGAGAEVVFGVILGTGTGGGIVVSGKVINGLNGIAGEWGHNPLPWPVSAELPGADCYCGRRGCIETFLSGPGLARDHFEATGQKLTGDQIVALADSGDATAEATMLRYEDRLARALSSIINVLDPTVIVLGGGVSNTLRLYKNVPTAWQKYVFSDQIHTKLLRAKHGDSSGVRGAAWLWP